MKKLLLKTMFFVVLFLIPKMVLGNVVINEIAWMGTTIDYNDEWIELYNDGDQIIDLTGWTLEAIDGQPKINLSGTIQAQSYFLLERTDDNSVADITADQIYSGALGNSGEYLTLKDNNETIIDDLNFPSTWPAGDNTTKQTMEKISISWQTSLNPMGTPRATNSTGAIEQSPSTSEETTASASNEASANQATPTTSPVNQPPTANAGDNIISFINQEIKFDGSKSSDPEKNDLHYEWNMGDGKLIEKPSFAYTYKYPGTYLVTLMVFDGKNYTSDTITVKIQSAQIIINEFMANPEGKDEEEEWIEIYNDADSITDISGWQLDDIVSGSSAFTFPKNTLIAGKSYIVFSRQTTKISLNNDKDSVRLLLPDGAVFQEINYEKPPQGKSSARTDEGFVWSEPTPGMANISGISTSNDKQTISQTSSIKPTTVKNSSKESIINLTENKIEGGYAQITTNESAPSTNKPTSSINKLAGIKQFSQNPLNLTLLVICIVFTSGFIGLLLVKFRKKSITP